MNEPFQPSARDREQLRGAGVSEEEARRQIDLLRDPPDWIDLVRPCSIGDGIDTVDEARAERLARVADEAAASGRLTKLVPASGAATRMFKDLLHCRALGGELTRARLDELAAAGSSEAAAAREFFDRIDRFAFSSELAAAVGSTARVREIVGSGPLEPILGALLDENGLGYALAPKGLLKFHAYAKGARTPFEEHLVEAIDLVKDRDGACRVHFTVSESHRERFARLLARVGPELERAHRARLQVGFSTQSRATDTLALGDDGMPFRNDDGSLLLRPAGHGALLGNLNTLGADVVMMKNIDNVAPDWLKPATFRWSRVVIGALVEMQRARGRDLPDRPLRVCGVVKNTGEPGGGPFWVRGKDGSVTAQIVERGQVDPDSAEQQQRFLRGTHFNPVFIAAGVRGPGGEPHDLTRFVDPDAVIISTKSSGGRELRALERPGLWNGAMAGWDTLFVEVPLEVFNPVKSINDLLRREHQPPAR